LENVGSEAEGREDKEMVIEGEIDEEFREKRRRCPMEELEHGLRPELGTYDKL
jgi:hypothetical protein